ncbi:MAG: hypothetical protein Q8R07_04270 [Candidatus Uhrbacteria bacterium]|nr:hypothetical protein [Candidatus Uhrbacteria bacterium]
MKLDIASLLEQVAAPPPRSLDDLAQLRIADIPSLTVDQVREAFHLVTQESALAKYITPDRKLKNRHPTRHLTFGALLSRARKPNLYKRWGYVSAIGFVDRELHLHTRCLSFRTMYDRAVDLGFTPEEIEDLEQRYAMRRVQSCVKYAVDKKHCLLALNSRRNMYLILYVSKGGNPRSKLTLGPFDLSPKKYLIANRMIHWLRKEFFLTDTDVIVAMMLITQAWLEKPPLERRRFLRAQLKELDIDPKIAERFF